VGSSPIALTVVTLLFIAIALLMNRTAKVIAEDSEG
jgi:uncharacterized membrane protein YgaE (UPF0421/DUF939 family)